MTALRDFLVARRSRLNLVPQQFIAADLRRVNDADKIDELRFTVHQDDQRYRLLKPLLVPEMIERQATYQFEHESVVPSLYEAPLNQLLRYEIEPYYPRVDPDYIAFTNLDLCVAIEELRAPVGTAVT